VTIEKMSLDGWVIIALTVLLGFVSVDVIISKLIGLSRMERADKAFLDFFRSKGHQTIVGILLRQHGHEVDGEWAKVYRHSTLYQLFKGAINQMSSQIHAGEHIDHQKLLSPHTIESVRSELEVALVEQANRVNNRMVWMTLAVSGAPFLGLLGTVVGVMITFTSVAASGDVNVSTIAPGVASAMATTVVGLIVAIPSLLAYNYLATQVARIVSLMEVFSEQLVESLNRFVSNVRSKADHTHKAHNHAA
jgi:biopolymer transport protein ExbB